MPHRKRRTRATEKIPEQHLVRLEDGAIERSLETLDRSCGPEAVSADEDPVNIVPDVRPRPFDNPAQLDLGRILRELCRGRTHDAQTSALKDAAPSRFSSSSNQGG
jgi:hypothetical protein